MTIRTGNYDLMIIQGATLDETFTWKDSAGVAVNLTGYTARMQIRNERGGATLYETLTTVPTEGITLGGAAGTIRIERTPVQTGAYTFERGVYDIELTVTATGVVTRLIEGAVVVSRQVTV